MARKRPPSPPQSPPSKRHLNNALAAELKSLRISTAPHSYATSRNVFGVAPSPFLSQPARNNRPYATDVSFDDDFVQNLQHAPDVPVVTSPEPEPQDMAIESDRSPTVFQSTNDDIIVEEYDDVDDGHVKTENRLIVYRPPVRMSPETYAKLNARLPDGQFILRNAKTDEWIMTEAQNERMKRKLALVPWTGDAKRTLYDRAASPSRVIPMPWHDTKYMQDKENIATTSAAINDAEQIMEVDEVGNGP